MSTLSLLTRGYITPVKKVVEQVLLTPQHQAILVKTLELPLSKNLTSALGIFQADIIIRSAIVAALADMRANPWLVEYVFASLPQDSLTWKEYGEKDLQQAKKWFMSTNIDVSVLPTFDESKWPKITIELLESKEVESETTLGDIHYDPTEGNDSNWPSLNESPINPVSYTPATGIVVLPIEPDFGIYAGMFLVDRIGESHEIIEVIDGTSFKINPNTVADLTGSSIKSQRPAWTVNLESSSFRETYRLGVHVQGESAHLTWAHSILIFCLQRYKQVLMEARGLERTTFGSSQASRAEWAESENILSKYITLTGYVRQYWPKAIAPNIDGVAVDTADGAGIRVLGSGSIATTGVDPNTQLWKGEDD